MSKTSHRPSREEHKEQQRQKKQAEKELRRQKIEQGMEPAKRDALPNRKSGWTLEEEAEARQQTVEGQAKAFSSMLPRLLEEFSKIKDNRNPKTIKHKLTVLLLYGLLCFVYHMSSRREANREMSKAQFLANLQLLFPELESLPHNDTLARLLANIEVEQIQTATLELFKQFIRNKKFKDYLYKNQYVIAIDGTQKFTSDTPLDPAASQRQLVLKNGETETKHYVYVLEANLVLHNVSIPLLSEILEYPDGDVTDAKQDCELKAFRRLAKKLKDAFPKLSIMLLLDGLYPNGPLLDLLREYHWDYMIVLQDESLKQVWTEYRNLSRLHAKEPGGNRHVYSQTWGDRTQVFDWVNLVIYEYGRKRKIMVNVVTCIETWLEIGEDGQVVERTKRYAWISGQPLTSGNVHQRCNLAARYRWTIENGFLTEKHQGYQYEHIFSYNWTAMKGYHYLMRLAHCMNSLAFLTKELAGRVAQMGKQPLIKFIRETIAAPWLDAERFRTLHNRSHQFRFAD